MASQGGHSRIVPTGAELYIKQVLDGQMVTSKKVRKLCEIMDARIRDGYKCWHYDRAAAMRPCTFIERFCYIPSGKTGHLIELELFQQFIINIAYGFVDDDGARQLNEILVIMGRKNGKTSLVAALEQYMLVADGEGAPQIYNLAVTQPQAALAYGAVNKMRLQSKSLRKRERTGTIPERHSAGIMCDRTMGYITTLAANADALDGLDTHCAVADEIAAWKDRGPYDLVRQSMSARTQPLMFEITTAGFVRNSIYDSQYDYATRWLDGEVEDDRFCAFIWELDERTEDWTDEAVWPKANPGLGTIKKVEALRSSVNKARQDASYLPTVLTKDFNLPQNDSSAWLTWDESGSDVPLDFDGMHFDYGIVGFDASDAIDLTAAQMLCMRAGDDHIYERSMYWIPESKLQEREDSGSTRNVDNVPYRLWEAKGLLRIVPGNNVPKSVLQEWIEELRDEHDVYTYAVGYDPWHMDDNTVKNLKMLVGESRCEVVRQGTQTLSDPMKRLRADYKDGRIIDGGHPINRWCRMNVMVRTDINQNIQPDKRNLSSLNRIDGFMAELDAYITLLRHYDDYLAML